MCGAVLRGGDGAADDTASSRDSYLQALLDAESSGEQAHAQSPAPPAPAPHAAAHVAPPVSAPLEQQHSTLGTAERVQRAPGERRPSAERASWSEPSTSTSSDLSEDLSEDRASESRTGGSGETAETTAETADFAAEYVVEEAEQLHAAVIERRRLLYGVKRQLSESCHAAPAAAATNVRPMPPAHACNPACANYSSSREHGTCVCVCICM